MPEHRNKMKSLEAGLGHGNNILFAEKTDEIFETVREISMSAQKKTSELTDHQMKK
jgi:hypothetical protein